MIFFMSNGVDVQGGWKEILLLMLGGFVGSFAKVWTEFNIPDLTKKVPVTLEIKVIIGVFITLIGTYLLLTSQFKLGVGNYLGDLIIFLGMLCASTNEVIGRKFMQTKVNQLSVNTFQYFTGFVLSFLILFIIWPNSSFEYTYHLNFSPSVIAALVLSFITFAKLYFVFKKE